MMKSVALLVLLSVGVALCAEESRHSSFYSSYRPRPPPRRPTYHSYYNYIPKKNFYFGESCCESDAFKSSGCSVIHGTSRYTYLPLSVCKCCIGDLTTYATIAAAAQTCASSTTSSAATTAAPVTTPTTAATTVTTAPTTTPTTTVPTTAVPTTTTAATTTTTAQTKHCPNSGCARRRRDAYDFMRSFRLQGGTPISSTCDYPGVVALEATAPTGDILTICTGALISATEIQIPSNCAETLNIPGATNEMAVIDGTKVPISSVSTATPLAIATLSTPVDITVAPSQACIYDSSMGVYDKSTCEIVGYGANAAGAQQATAQTAAVTFDALACANVDTTLTVAGATYGCASMSSAAACAGDGGALIMCDLVETGEKVVIGQAETFDCDTTVPAVYFQMFDV